VVELAQEYGYTSLPTTDVAELAQWFNRGAKRNDLVLYLETFAHTVAGTSRATRLRRTSGVLPIVSVISLYILAILD
jgi:adenosine deaminase